MVHTTLHALAHEQHVLHCTSEFKNKREQQQPTPAKQQFVEQQVAATVGYHIDYRLGLCYIHIENILF